LDAGFGIAAAVDGVPLRAFTGVAVVERVLALGSTFVLKLAVAAGVDAAGAVDAADPAVAAGSVDAARAGRSASFGGGMAMAIAPLFSGAVKEAEFPLKAAIEALPSQPTPQSLIHLQVERPIQCES
jgi:hypothetical protein